jgi:hypothetical protein
VPGVGVPAAGARNPLRCAPPSPDPETLWSPAPIFGFRFWRVDVDGLYGSTGVRWGRPSLEAECRSPRGLRLQRSGGRLGLEPEPFGPGEAVPHLSCSCGIYAVPDVSVLVAAAVRAVAPGLRIPEGGSFGIVALTGRVVEHEHGWRAARATVTALLIVTRSWYVFTARPGDLGRIFADPITGLAGIERRTYPGGGPDEWVGMRSELAQRLAVLKRSQEERWTSESRSA